MLSDAELLAPNDLLIQHDLHAPADRHAWAHARISTPALADAFLACAADRALRAVIEFTFCGCMAAEDLPLLLEEGLVEMLAAPFISHVGHVHGEWFHEIRLSRCGRLAEAPRQDGTDPNGLLHDAVRGYLARTTGDGIIMGRPLMEVAFDMADMALLRLAVDPMTGEPLLARLPAGLPLWGAPPPADVEAARRERLKWWASDAYRSVTIHDLGLRHGILPGSIQGIYVTRGVDPEEAAAARHSPW